MLSADAACALTRSSMVSSFKHDPSVKGAHSAACMFHKVFERLVDELFSAKHDTAQKYDLAHQYISLRNIRLHSPPVKKHLKKGELQTRCPRLPSPQPNEQSHTLRLHR